jgi:hypothetical protein
VPQPIVITSDASLLTERVDVFSIDGVMYSMPKVINAAIALRAVEIIEQGGDLAVIPFMFRETIGPDGYEALKNCVSLKPSDLQAVTKIIADHVLGAVEKSMGE